MTKIIGFLITKDKITPKIDFFDSGLNQIRIEYCGFNIHLWGLGKIENYKINGKYSLSFPLHDSLLDRNIIISFKNNTIIIENDWLGSIPVFYNSKETIVSTLSNLCIKEKSINLDGLANFCEFGYSVFEQTMFNDIKFMRYYSKLTLSVDKVEIEYKMDPILENSFVENESNEDEVIQLMQDYISNIESSIDGDIILPTSGGYDSRILNYFITNKNRIKSFTYGVSKKQSQSTEVVHAQKIAAIYKTKWEQIELTDVLNFIDKWFSVYGISTHLHGMYHIEFYTKILNKNQFINPSFLSGIIGDAWAGSGKFSTVECYDDLINIGFTHGMNVVPNYLIHNNNKNKIKKAFYDTNKKYLLNEKLRTIFTMRVKLMLISYLTQIPEYFSLPVWTPFLNYEIVKKTLNLPDKKRTERLWQKYFFEKVGLNLEDMNLKSSEINKLDYEIARNSKLCPIDIDIMSVYIKKDRLIEINYILIFSKTSIIQSIINQLYYIPKVRGILRLFGFKKNKLLQALHEYYVIKAIEKGIQYGEDK